MKHIIFFSFFLFFLFFLFFSCIIKENFEQNNNTKECGFIVTRHVSNSSQNNVWITCIERIRVFYPDTLIVIIDDKSNYEFINYPENFLNNCIVIDSEFKGAGELLPYYYYYHNKWFEKAIFIHDSVFINNEIDSSNVNYVKFLWDFPSTSIYHEKPHIELFLSYLNYRDELIDLFNSNDWVGCYGVMSVIKHSYVKKIANKYNLFALMPHVKERIHRMAMERVFAILCFHDKEINEENASIYGIYNASPGYNKYNYDTYIDNLNNNNMIEKVPIKLFFGR